MTRTTCLLVLLAYLQFVSGTSIAQSYPNKPIRVIVGSPPGSVNDTGARILTGVMQKRLGQPMIVENRAGAQNTLAPEAVVKASPDGYTIMFSTAQGVHPLFVKVNALDVGKRLLPISESMSGPLVLFASAKLPITSFQELVAFAKANPEKVNNAVTGAFTALAAAMVKSSTGHTETLIPYKGAAQIIPALISGDAHIAYSIYGPWADHVQSGAVRPLLVMASSRIPQLPNVPTAEELGMPKMYAGYDGGFWAPPGTPKEIIDRLSQEAVAAVRMPEIAGQIRALGYVPVGSTPEEQLRIFEEGIRFWAEAARLTQFQPQ